MDINKVKIVCDSSVDLLEMEDIAFSSVPLKIITDKKEYPDDEHINIEEMVDELKVYKGKSTTSCPAMTDWLERFDDKEFIFCISLTGTLSGSYNSAVLAKQEYEAAYPGRHVYVIDSQSAGPEMKLIAYKLRELAYECDDMVTMVRKINDYRKNLDLVFSLESLQNLANNGRVSPAVAKIATVLGMRVVGKASDRGDLEPVAKVRGEKKALEELLKKMKEYGYKGGRVFIDHCFNEDMAKNLRRSIKLHYPLADVKIAITRALCSFYAEKGGMLVGFETN